MDKAQVNQTKSSLNYDTTRKLTKTLDFLPSAWSLGTHVLYTVLMSQLLNPQCPILLAYISIGPNVLTSLSCWVNPFLIIYNNSDRNSSCFQKYLCFSWLTLLSNGSWNFLLSSFFVKFLSLCLFVCVYVWYSCLYVDDPMMYYCPCIYSKQKDLLLVHTWISYRGY